MWVVAMIKFFWNIDCAYRKKILLFYVLQLLNATMSVILVIVLGRFLDELISGDLRIIKNLMFIFILICLSQLLIGYIMERLYMQLQVFLGNKVMLDIIYHINDTKKFVQGQVDNIGEVEKINNDANAIVIFGLAQISKFLYSAFEFVIATILLLILFPRGFLSLVILFIVYILVYLSIRNIYYERGYEFKEYQVKYFTKMFEQLSHSKIMHLFSLYDFFKARMNVAYDNLEIAALKLQKISYIFTSVGGIIKVIGNLMLYLLCGLAVINKNISIGVFTIVVSMFDVILGSCLDIFEIGKSFQETKISYNRLMELKKINTINYGCKDIESNIEVIDINNIKINYGENTLLNGFTACFRAGKIYCISGRNGIGKTTLFECMLGLNLDEMEGDIFYNGESIRNIALRKFRIQHITYIEQFTSIINGTIVENIELFEKCEIERSLCETLNIEEFICEHTGKVFSDNGVGLSGGEKQKIGLIRGLSACKEVVLLDEPTASLDKDTAKQLFSYLNSVKKEKIIIVISHDENIMSLCDEILFM